MKCDYCGKTVARIARHWKTNPQCQNAFDEVKSFGIDYAETAEYDSELEREFVLALECERLGILNMREYYKSDNGKYTFYVDVDSQKTYKFNEYEDKLEEDMWDRRCWQFHFGSYHQYEDEKPCLLCNTQKTIGRYVLVCDQCKKVE